MEKAPHSGEVRMSFMEHLVELRQRLVKSVIAVCIGFGAAYTFAERLFGFLTIPYNQAYREVFHREAKLVNTGLIEPFLVYLKVGMMAGVFLASPFIFYQLWQFVAPGLRPQERKHVVPFVLLASLFFIGGALFGYFGVFPIGFKYFLSVAPAGYVDPLIRMDEYYRLAAWMMVVFGLVFEGPLIVLYL
ncbi:MAG TPA: twin-arginine translocase subunit TatC, partial [Bdellovibrionota bacterium]|nr:twin-arginine translocase subunit TatC [Bdellovibrionota bacterium]